MGDGHLTDGERQRQRERENDGSWDERYEQLVRSTTWGVVVCGRGAPGDRGWLTPGGRDGAGPGHWVVVLLSRLAASVSRGMEAAARSELNATSIPWHHQRAISVPLTSGIVRPGRRDRGADELASSVYSIAALGTGLYRRTVIPLIASSQPDNHDQPSLGRATDGQQRQAPHLLSLGTRLR